MWLTGHHGLAELVVVGLLRAVDVPGTLSVEKLVDLFCPLLGVELLELYLPFEFVEEPWDNKLSDLVVNTIGLLWAWVCGTTRKRSVSLNTTTSSNQR